MGPEAVKLMLAIKLRYPTVEAGAMVDPYIAAYDAALNPEAPAFNAALRELLNADVLSRSAESDRLTARAVSMNLQYKVTPEGERLIADA
jgi:hypothetical protein